MANRLLFSRSIHTIATKPSLFSTRKLDGLLLANCDVSLVGCTYQAKKKNRYPLLHTPVYIRQASTSSAKKARRLPLVNDSQTARQMATSNLSIKSTQSVKALTFGRSSESSSLLVLYAINVNKP